MSASLASHTWHVTRLIYTRQSHTHTHTHTTCSTWKQRVFKVCVSRLLLFFWARTKRKLHAHTRTMSGSNSWHTFSTPHSDALHLTAFPSAVPLIFHIRLLIITASRTICFWTNLPAFQINIRRQVNWYLSSLSLSLLLSLHRDIGVTFRSPLQNKQSQYLK